MSEDERLALADMAEQGERWIEARAAGRDADMHAAGIESARVRFRRAEHKRRKAEKGAR